MKKISTLFKKNPENLGRVINEINPENKWVFDGDGIPTRKFDGTSCSIIDGDIYRRYDTKKRRKHHKGGTRKQEEGAIIEHHPHCVKCSSDKPHDKNHFLVFMSLKEKKDGRYEICGEKVNGNPKKIK